jgi:hypothetical protein
LAQTLPDGHAFPHEPQLLGSLPVSTQLPLHRVSPAGHCAGWQMPLTHESPLGQVLPQAPQLLGSLDVSTQSPEHIVLPGGQVQTPLAQCCPAPHLCPQRPQLRGSDLGLTHLPLHR